MFFELGKYTMRNCIICIVHQVLSVTKLNCVRRLGHVAGWAKEKFKIFLLDNLKEEA
jgi:hypothetical protein